MAMVWPQKTTPHASERPNNMETFLFGFGLLLSYFAWKAWKRTALDTCRDRLFDIRDDARRYFIEHNIPLDDKVYIALRTLLNAHIRYAKRMTFPTFVAMTWAMHEDQEVMQNMRGEINARLATKDADLTRFIASVRKQSSEAMMQYIGETSAFIIFSVIIGWPLYVTYKCIKVLGGIIREQKNLVFDSFDSSLTIAKQLLKVIFRSIPLAIVGMVMALPVRAGSPETRYSSASLLEEYSYESSLVR